MDRNHAASLCTQHGGHLVETVSREDIEFVSTMAAISDTFTGIHSWWIGLGKDGDEWTWSFSNSSLEETNWGTGEPSPDKSCAILSHEEGSTEFSWRTALCDTSSDSLAPICQQCLPGEDCSGGHFPLGCHVGYDGQECYVLVNTPMTWDKAEEYCQRLDGQLASIVSEEENVFVGSSLLGYYSVWLGGQGSSGSGWSWTDGSPWVWTNWAENQPTGHYEPECALMDQNSYKWASYYCQSELKFLFTLYSQCWPHGFPVLPLAVDEV